jgi:hypothetical protein
VSQNYNGKHKLNTLEVFFCPKRGVVYLDLECGDWFNVTSDGISIFARKEGEEQPYAYVGEVKKERLKNMFFMLKILEKNKLLENY